LFSSLIDLFLVVSFLCFRPFITRCFEDLCAYGMCAYYKKKRGSIVTPVHVPMSKCTITYGAMQEIEVSPKSGRREDVPDRTKVFVLEEPDTDVMRLNSPFCRLLHQYKRLSELSTSYIEEERRIAKPVNFLEDPNTSKSGIYQAVTAANPEWDHGVPGLHLSAREASDGHAATAEYITHLQGQLVDQINRGSDDQESTIDSLGIRREKRKRVQEVQVSLPPGKRLVQHMPSNRCNILQFEEHFSNLIPWCMGVPPVFMQAKGGNVSLSTSLIGTVVNCALENHVMNINNLLEHVSQTLFGTMAELMDRDMIVQIDMKKELELDDDQKSAPGQSS